MKTKTTARLLSLIALLAMVLTLCFTFPIGASAASHDVSNMAELESAIAGAQSGDVIYITEDFTLTGATGTIKVTKKKITITSKQDETKEGTEIFTITRAVGGFPMFTIDGQTAEVTLKNITIDGNNVPSGGNGGAFGQDEDATDRRLTLGEGATLKNLKAANGGAAYVRVVIMNGGTIENCSASTNGGGLYVSAQFTMNGGTITGNTATSAGGGAYVAVLAATKLAGGSITNNNAKLGGGVTLGKTTSNTTVSGTKILENTATTTGGGIYLGGGTLNVTGGEISGNTATTYGGGICLGKATLHVTGGLIQGNTSKSDNDQGGGGGIHSSADGSIVLGNGAKVLKNKAVRGGGLFSFGTVTINEGALISENTSSKTGAGAQIMGTLTMAGGSISGNTATTNGGGIYLGGGTLNVTGGEISGNTATTYGGGICLGKATLHVTGGLIQGNTSKGDNAQGGGGGIHSSADGSIVLGNGAKVLKNKAVRGGGLFSLGTVTINEGALISENTSSKTGAGAQIRGTLTMAGGSISDNTATSLGGGIYLVGTTEMTGGDISNNKAKNGAGVFTEYNVSSNFNITGGSIKENEASEIGGGIYGNTGATITIGGNAKISGNSSGTTGGGIFMSTGQLTITGGSISGNNATTEGGGICMQNGGLLTMTDGSLSGNTSKSNGGGLYAKTTGYVLISGGEISRNTGKYGGGMTSVTTTTVITGEVSISNNTATGRGGAVYLTGATGRLFLAGGEMEANSASGAAIDVANGASLIMLGGKLTSHAGSFVIQATQNSNIHLLGGSITGNSANMAVAGAAETNGILGKSITLSGALADEIVSELAKSVTVSDDSLTLTSTTPIKICDNTGELGNISGYVTDDSVNTFNLTLAEDLVAGSRVVFEDNAETDGYFLTLANDYSPSEATLNAIQLNGADATYKVTVSGATLVWPSEAYQVWQNAGLRDDIAFRLYFFMRDKNQTPTVTFGGGTVTLGIVDQTLADAIKKPEYQGLSYAEIRLAPKQISETVTVTAGETTKEYSFVAYLSALDKLVADGSTLKTLIAATRNYCTAAQAYFGETEDRANANYQTDIKKIEAKSGLVLTQFAGKTLPRFKSASVVLEDKVSVKIIIKQWVENFRYTVTLGGNSYTPATKYDAESGLYMIVVENISACDLADRIVVTMTYGEETATLDYSVLEYAINKQGVAEGGLDYVAKALYAYANAAAAYVAAN